MTTRTRRPNARPANCKCCGTFCQAGEGFLYRDTHGKPNRYTGKFGWFVKCAKCHGDNETGNSVKMARKAAVHDAAVEAMGGDFTIEELRTAEVKVVELPRQYVAIPDPWVVWTIRGKEWFIGKDMANEPFGMALLEDRFNWLNGRKFTYPGFKSAAAKKFAKQREEQVFDAYANAATV